MLEIVMSTVAFYRGEVPREIALRDCSLPMATPPATAFCAFYGDQGKQNGFMAARQHAVAHGLQYTVIDFVMELEAQNKLVMKPDDLASFDFLNFARMSKEMRGLVSEWFSEANAGRGVPVGPGETRSASAAIEAAPSLVDTLIANPTCHHLKVIAFQTITSLTSKPFAVGSVPHRHWSAIRSATCRLNPNVRILLDAPTA